MGWYCAIGCGLVWHSIVCDAMITVRVEEWARTRAAVRVRVGVGLAAKQRDWIRVRVRVRVRATHPHRSEALPNPPDSIVVKITF